MNTRSAPSLLEGVVVAAVLAGLGGVVFASLQLLVTPSLALRTLTIVLSGAYALYLLVRSDRHGGVALAASWSIAAAASAGLIDSLALLLIVHVTLIWLLRCLSFHDSIVAALADLLLSALALAAAVWAATHTGSFALSVWCALLVQALFVALPRALPAAGVDGNDTRFERAQRSAEAALRRLQTSH